MRQHMHNRSNQFVCVSRSNLDPFNQYSEDQIWDALGRSHMKECVSIISQKL